MSRPISCVIPTHSRNDYLREALRSVGEQTLRPAQVIVVSDVPNDEARRITEDFAREAGLDAVFVDNSSGRRGASGSRNRGAAEATGDLLAFLDDDDLWTPTYLERVDAVFAAGSPDMVVTWITKFSENDRRQDGATMKRGLTHHAAAAVNPGATGSNIVVTRASFDGTGGFDPELPVKNDTDFLFRYLRHGYAYDVVEERNVLQRKHTQGQLMAFTETRAQGAEKYLAKHRADLRAGERRRLRASIHRIRAHAAPTRWKRAFHAASVAALSPTEGITLLRDYRHRQFALVEQFAPEQPATRR